MLLNDKRIKELAKLGMIQHWAEKTKEVDGQRVISYGLNSFGYDIRLSDKFKVYPCVYILDPKKHTENDFINYTGNIYTLLPNSFILGLSIEEFNIPNNIVGICLGKSTYARCGLIVNVTPLEPGWKGRLVIEIANLGRIPVQIYANEGIAQVLFFQDEVPEQVYNGFYQNQTDFKVGIQ